MRPGQPATPSEFNGPVVLHELATGRTKELKGLSIACATWARDGRAFTYVSRRGIEMFDVASGKAQVLVPSTRKLHDSATVSIDPQNGASVMSINSTYVGDLQECDAPGTTRARHCVCGARVQDLSTWLWMGERSERQALVALLDRDGRSLASLAIVDLKRSTVTPVLDGAAINRVTGDATGLRLVGWIPGARVLHS